MPLAAVAHKEVDKAGKRRIGGAVDDRPPFAPGCGEPGLFQMTEMERHARRGGSTHRFADRAG